MRNHQEPSATVRVAPLYWMCRCVAYLCVAFPRHIAKVCEKFVNYEEKNLYKPCLSVDALDSCSSLLVMQVSVRAELHGGQASTRILPPDC